MILNIKTKVNISKITSPVLIVIIFVRILISSLPFSWKTIKYEYTKLDMANKNHMKKNKKPIFHFYDKFSVLAVKELKKNTSKRRDKNCQILMLISH